MTLDEILAALPEHVREHYEPFVSEDPVWVMESASIYLGANEEERQDMDDFLAGFRGMSGPERIRQAHIELESGTPSAETLWSWKGDGNGDP